MRQSFDIGLIIPLGEEFESAREILRFENPDGDFYYPFSIPGSSLRGIATVLFEMGQVSSSEATTRLLARFDVRLLALVGIAGALDTDLHLGDVVIAEAVDEYLHAAKAIPGDTGQGFEFELGSFSWRAGYDIVSYANNFEFLGSGADLSRWRERGRRRDPGLRTAMPELAKEVPDYRVGVIATGDVVGAAEAFARWLRRRNRRLVAIEMEAGGVARALYREGRTDLIVVRGISDFADERKDMLDSTATPAAGSRAWRRYAMLNAADLFAVLVTSPHFPWPDRASDDHRQEHPVGTARRDAAMHARASGSARIYQAGHADAIYQADTIHVHESPVADHAEFSAEGVAVRHSMAPRSPLPLSRRSMERRRVPLVAAAVALVGVLIDLVISAVPEAHWPSILEILKKYPWPSLAILTLVLLVLGRLALPATRRARQVDLRSIADDLAAAVRVQWENEQNRRLLDDPWTIPVRWIPADRECFASWSALARLASTGPGWPMTQGSQWAHELAELRGSGNELVNVLRRVPTGRLVVLGEPGAGKTVLLVRLVLDLLARRQPGGPVPVLLPLASWNPVEEDLRDWIVHRLITDWPALGGMAADATGMASFLSDGTWMNLARALLDDGLILVVLDGLDEIPTEAGGTAIARINDAMRPGQGLILASRTDAYESAAHPVCGTPVWLKGAAGIELCLLEISEVGSYLRQSAGPKGADRWDPVIAAFTSDRRSPVGEALATPLMVSLARAVYNPRPGEETESSLRAPVELLDTERFPSSMAVQDYLLDHFVSTSYKRHPDRRWSASDAERWLVFLARNLQFWHNGTIEQAGTTDFEWWRLPDAAPKHLASVVVGLVAAIACGLWFPFVGLGVGLILGICAGLMVRMRFGSGKIEFIQAMVGSLLGGGIAASIAFAVLGPGPGDRNVASFFGGAVAAGIVLTSMGRFTAAFVAGFVGETAIAFYEHAPLFQQVRANVGSGLHLINGVGAGLTAALAVEFLGGGIPARGLRWSPGRFLCGAGSGIVSAALVWIQAGQVIGIFVGIVSIIAAGLFGLSEAVSTDLSKAIAPRVVLLRDKSTFLASWAGFGIALGGGAGLEFGLSPAANGHPNGIGIGVEIGLANLIATGLTVAFIQARWGSFTVVRCWLAISRQLPWRLMTFLDDAHANRGILRQFGAVYQFRHAELQRRLARHPINEREGSFS